MSAAQVPRAAIMVSPGARLVCGRSHRAGRVGRVPRCCSSACRVSLLQGNALKTVLLGVANAVAAVGFAVFGPVEWWAVLPLAAGLLVGA